ncbi:MAG: PfkB family carbohydrate kinase [Planctomycetota bacterium]
MSLIVTGAVGIDRVETPAGQAEDLLGGSGAYFPAAASFFTRARLLAAVGGDFPDGFVEVIDRFGIDRAGLERRPDGKSFRWHGRYHTDMNKRDTVSVELGVLLEDPPPMPEAYKDSRFVFAAVDQPVNQLALLDRLPGAALTVMDTIDLYINTAKDELTEVMKRVGGIVINDEEARAYTGESNTVVAAEKLAELGPKFVVVKKGEHGVIVKHRDGWAALPAYPSTKVVDPTGAGDCFAGAMMGFLTEAGEADPGLPALQRAVAYGTVVASYSIEAFSLGRLESLDRAAIDQRYASFRNIVSL